MDLCASQQMPFKVRRALPNTLNHPLYSFNFISCSSQVLTFTRMLFPCHALCRCMPVPTYAMACNNDVCFISGTNLDYQSWGDILLPGV